MKSRKAVAVSLLLFSLAVPASARSLPDNTGAFESYQSQDLQKFEKQKAANNAPDGLDAKKAEMDRRFSDMKKQFDENGSKMGEDNGFMEKKSDKGVDTDDFKRNDPASNLNDLRSRAKQENDVLSQKKRQGSNDTADDTLQEVDEGEDDSSFSLHVPSFFKDNGIIVFGGGAILLGVMGFLYLRGDKTPPEERKEQ